VIAEVSTTERCRRADMATIGSGLVYADGDGSVHDLEEEALAGLVVRWERFEPIVDVLARHVGAPDFAAAAGTLRLFGRGPQRSWLLRRVGALLRALQRQQVAGLARDPAFARMQAVLARGVEAGWLLAESALRRRIHLEAPQVCGPAIGCVAILTRNAPARLMRCLTSYLH
jgi:hypothetical protein